MRPPGFEPGSSAWQADVLVQTRRRPHPTIQVLKNVINVIPTKTKETIINTCLTLKRNGIKGYEDIGYRLNQIARKCDINKPEEVKTYISNARTKRTNEPIQDATKNRLLYCYDKYCQTNGIQWNKPYYKVEEKTPLIPTTQNINLIISNASKKYAPIFTILAEIGCSPNELYHTTQNDIDTEQGIIRIRGTKGHASGAYKLKTITAEMLRQYLAKHRQNQPFPKARAQSQVWIDTRKRATQKLCKPELEKIQLRNLRNYSGAQHYHKFKDPIAVMRHLRHKKLETTMHYIRAITIEGEEEYTVKTATNIKEATDLLEHGFTYIQDIEGIKLYRKRK